MISDSALSFGSALAVLKAASEETRLRILALLAQGELSVSDLTDILGQSQPRISRHLKLMTEAGLVERHREGSWAFFRLVSRGSETALVKAVVEGLEPSDPVLAADRARLGAVRQARARAAEAYFARHASEWDKIRSLHVSEEAVEEAVEAALGPLPINSFLDLGTGTGRMLKLLAPRVTRAVGVDVSHAMLAVARANLGAAGLSHVELRQGDIYAPPVEHNAFDLVLIHQVLHFLDDPARAVREAASLLRPGGRLLIVDFAAHALEELRETQTHRRLGFGAEQIEDFMGDSKLDLVYRTALPPPEGDEKGLTVLLWLGRDRRVITDMPLSRPNREVA